MTEKQLEYADVKIHPPILTLIHIALAYILSTFIPIPFSVPTILRWIGFGGVIAGFLCGAFAFAVFRKANTTLDPHGQVSAIVSSGIYNFTRNPIYLGFSLMLIGIPLNSGSWWGLILLPVFVWMMNRLVIEREETYLEEKFGEAYTSYRRRVRRWF